MRPYILAENNWKTIQETDFDLAILPWGATEAHNYHLPYATDNLEAEHIAAESARIAWEKGAKIIVLPTIPFGVNTGQTDIKLDINLNPSTQMAILSDIIEVLNRQGIYKLLVFNSHGGNDFKTLLRELGLKYPKMFLCTSNWFKALDKTQYFEYPGDHADEMETSLILYLRPELVRPLEEAGDGSERKNKIKDFSEGWVWAERRWSQITADTGVGFPKAATAQKGAIYFKDLTKKIAAFLLELAQCDVTQLYE
ncbi:MAG: creatininase family protein [Microscillaceae bacterium]|nr:creatininase family protein [Microscillaceae bacterium]